MKAIRAMSVESVLEADFRAATQASYKMLAKTGPISGLSFGMSSCLVLVAEGERAALRQIKTVSAVKLIEFAQAFSSTSALIL